MNIQSKQSQLFLIFIFSFIYSFSQTAKKNTGRDSLNTYIQFSGVVLSNNDSLKPIPLTSVIIKIGRAHV